MGEDKRASGESVREGSIRVGFLGERWEGEERDREEEKIIFQKVNTWTSELNRSSTLAYSSRRDNQRRKDQLRNTVYVNSSANRAECNVN